MSNFKINGKLVWNGDKAILDFNNAQGKALNMASILVENAAVKNVNHQVYSTEETENYRRTGALRASIDRTVTDDDAVVGSAIEYAPYVEFGTRKTGERPFLKPALILNVQKILNIFKKLNRAVKYVD